MMAVVLLQQVAFSMFPVQLVWSGASLREAMNGAKGIYRRTPLHILVLSRTVPPFEYVFFENPIAGHHSSGDVHPFLFPHLLGVSEMSAAKKKIKMFPLPWLNMGLSLKEPQDFLVPTFSLAPHPLRRRYSPPPPLYSALQESWVRSFVHFLLQAAKVMPVTRWNWKNDDSELRPRWFFLGGKDFQVEIGGDSLIFGQEECPICSDLLMLHHWIVLGDELK